MESKLCERCGTKFTRNPRYSAERWEKARFCSRACGVRGGRWAAHEKPQSRNCENCGGSFTPRPTATRPGRFCSTACYHASGAPRGKKLDRVKAQRMRSAPGHPIAPPGGVVAVARLVLYDKIGPGSHPCHWCDESVRWIVGCGPGEPGTLIADHLDWDRNNDNPENLVASCHRCNVNRTRTGKGRSIADDELTVSRTRGRTRAIKRNCEFCNEQFLTIPATVRAGKGRFCSRSCARKWNWESRLTG